MKKYVLSLILLCSSMFAFGQYYETSLGLRAGTGLNVSAKKFLSSATAVEGILGLYSFGGQFQAFGITALYQIHQPIPNNEHQLDWYYGFGGSVVLGDITLLGANANIGIEYVFEDLPLNFAIDAIPSLLFGDGGSNFDVSFSAAVRYILD